MAGNVIRKPIRVSLDSLKQHPSDPFKPYSEDKLRELADSIAEHGLFEPVIVRAQPDGVYEILAGKNRANAARLNGCTEIDAFLINADEATALMIITDSNLKHRDKLLPSERGFAYRLQLEAIKKQGKRSDTAERETSLPRGWKSESAHKVAEHNAVSKNSIRRYIRLTYLIPELLALVDNGELPFVAGIDLSFLDEQSQWTAHKYFYVDNKLSMNVSKSELIKKAFKEDNTAVTAEFLKAMFERRKTYKKDKPFTIPRAELKEFAAEIPDKETFIRLFFEFLKKEFGAEGTAKIVRKRQKLIF